MSNMNPKAGKPDSVADRLNKLHRSISTYKKITFDAMVECGKLLTEQKRTYDGEFTKWLKDNVDFSERTAQKYMRVYRLVKRGEWDHGESVAQNLRSMAEPTSVKSLARESVSERVASERKIPYSKAKEIVAVVDKFPETAKVFEPSEEQESKIRVLLFEAMERGYDLGKRNKLLPIKEKRDYFDKIMKVMKSDSISEKLGTMKDFYRKFA